MEKVLKLNLLAKGLPSGKKVCGVSEFTENALNVMFNMFEKSQ